MAWAVRQKLPCTQKIVLMMLAERHNQDSGQCNPSHDRLADDCGLTRRSVMDQVAKLAEAGYIRIRHRAANNVKLPNQYVLVFSFGVQAEVKDCAEVANVIHHTVVKQAHHVVNHVPEVVNHVHQGSEPVAHKPGIEPGIEPKEKKKRVTAPPFPVPDWINKMHWDAWHSCAKRKNATPQQKQMAVDKLDAWRRDGVDHAAALENAAIGGWQGLFKPDERGHIQATGETAYQRSMRERMQEAAPDIARRNPAAPQQDATDFFRTVDTTSRVVDIKAIEVTQ